MSTHINLFLLNSTPLGVDTVKKWHLIILNWENKSIKKAMKFSLPNWMLLNKKQLLENNRFKDSPLLNSLSTDNQLIIKEPEKKTPSTVGFRRKLDLLPNTLHLKMNSNLTLNSKFLLFTSYLKEKINI